jgi:hypothetical protein
VSATAVDALIFDLFGTVVDWRSGVSAEAFVDAWRGRYHTGARNA